MDEEGAPLLDWGLAVEALNKVDAGVPEKVGGAGGCACVGGGCFCVGGGLYACGGWGEGGQSGGWQAAAGKSWLWVSPTHPPTHRCC